MEIRVVKPSGMRYGSDGPFKFFRDEIRRFNLKSILSRINETTQNIEAIHRTGRTAWPDTIALSFIAHISILVSNIHRHTLAQPRDIEKLCRIFEDIICEHGKILEGSVGKFKEYMFPVAYSINDVSIKYYDYILPRSWMIFSELSRKMEYRKIFDFRKEFQSLTGQTFEGFFLSGYGLHHHFCLYPITTHNRLGSDHSVSKFLYHNCATQDYFRKTYNIDFSDISSWCKTPIFFFTPIIELPDKSFLAPIPNMLYERISDGIYHLILTCLKDKNKRQYFLNLFGLLFQDYIGVMLHQYLPAENISPERKFQNYSGKKVDFVLYDRESIVLIDCKTARLSLETRESGNPDLIIKDLAKGVAKGFWQINTVRNYILNNSTPYDRFNPYSKIFGLVIVADSLHYANEPFFQKDYVKPALRKINGISNREVDEIFIQKYSIMDAEEFELLIPHLKRISWKQLFELKMESEAKVASSWRNFVCANTTKFPDDITNTFLLNKKGKFKEMTMDLLRIQDYSRLQGS